MEVTFFFGNSTFILQLNQAGFMPLRQFMELAVPEPCETSHKRLHLVNARASFRISHLIFSWQELFMQENPYLCSTAL